jgi:excinuclease UvrABC nuclease subunit
MYTVRDKLTERGERMAKKQKLVAATLQTQQFFIERMEKQIAKRESAGEFETAGAIRWVISEWNDLMEDQEYEKRQGMADMDNAAWDSKYA